MILVVGSLNMDLVIRVSHLPYPGETVLGEAYEAFPGGKGANQAVAAARLGGRVRMIGRVGEDAFGQALRERLAQEGVDAAWVRETPGPSGTAFILVDPKGQNQIAVAPGANAHLTPEDLPETAFKGAKVVLLQLEVPLQTVARAVALGRKVGARILLNAAPAQALPPEIRQEIDLLLVNELEAAQLAGLPSPRTPEEALVLARHLRHLVPRAQVVLTLGAQGAVWSGDEEGHLPAFSVRVVDTTAAGDAFAGGLAVAMAEGWEMRAALRFANAAGALAATRPGAQSSLPFRQEVEALLEGER
ncbi:ribokinase [Thermus sp. LT1-2-5]|uniref:ribokinase n=1 Tax=Thermus sp. LT1-2-5 TaxID=3026935 RepID=UPI0030EB1163